MPLACFQCSDTLLFAAKHAKGMSLRYGVFDLTPFEEFDALFANNPCYHQCFFAVKRRAVFILEAKWKALVRGWRRDCVVGCMETRFQ